MKSNRPVFTLLLYAISYIVVRCCIFPETYQGQTWHTYVKPEEFTRTAVYFRGGILEFQDEETDKGFVVGIKEKHCIRMLDVGTYIVSTFTDRFSYNKSFECIVFLNRSRSILQLQMSRHPANSPSGICDVQNLEVDPWLLVSYPIMQHEFTTCPFIGGFNMKIKYKDGSKHGCNFVDVPMRFESECLTGEGITLDFRTPNCVGQIPMLQVQKFTCIAHWRQGGDVISVIRKLDSDDVWCMRIPARKSFNDGFQVILFTEPSCNMESISELEKSDINFYILELTMVIYNSLCADEHEFCYRLPCNKHFYSQCLKTCGKCNPNVYPTTCDFPRRIRGEWFSNDINQVRRVNISETQLHIDNVGDFQCISFPHSPPRKDKKFTTVSFFNNGCRPRYTCVGFTRNSASSIGYSLSQSKVWPLERHFSVGLRLCDSDSFKGDPPPLYDSYRSFNDVSFPLVTSSMESVYRQPCSLPSTYSFNATFHNRFSKCYGNLYQVCNEPWKLRMEFDHCSAFGDAFQFTCIGKIDSKYWEKIILLQNLDDQFDTRCLIISDIDPQRLIMMASKDCDKLSWTYVNVGIRVPMIDLDVVRQYESCRTLPTTSSANVVNDAQYDKYYGTNDEISPKSQNVQKIKYKDMVNLPTTDVYKFRNSRGSENGKPRSNCAIIYPTLHLYVFNVMFILISVCF